MGHLARSITVGYKRRGWKAFQTSLSVVGAAWLITEVANFVFPAIGDWVQVHQLGVVITVGFIVAASSLAGAYEPSQVAFVVPTTNTRLTIEFGDLFDQPTDIIISVNEFFDGQIGQVVAAKSVHGQFIAKYFQSDAQAFRQVIDPLLPAGVGQAVARTVQPDISFPIGTTVRVPIGANFAYLVALTVTDPQTHKASSDIAKFWTATTNVLETVYLLGNGHSVSMPLLGNGQASLNLPAQQILRLLVLAIVATARKAQLPDSIKVVLSPDCFEHVDLRDLKQSWRS